MSLGRSARPNQPPAAGRPAGAPGAPDDTAAGVLRLIEAQRGHLFSEKEYVQQRRTILVELAEGARLRPFTWFTFTVVELGLAAFVLIGLIAGRSGDYTLAWISFVALLCAAGMFYQFYLGVCRDLAVYEKNRAALLTRHFLVSRYFVTNYLSHGNRLGFVDA
ncbi:MAG TPA: hypothetical protein VNU68_10685, partial [Verrucomicrobiae bacterium]|nr:hypothetical protein [Verrucomicrobiae bacterium]